jgi:small subunit ribosomal protein S16
MLAIRLQRTGRKGHAQFRVIVQESRLSPTSGRVVAQLGSYNPHTKEVILAKDKAELYLKNGAQPSERAASLLQKEGVKLPTWVKLSTKKEGKLKNPEKLRKNQPAAPAEEAPEAEAPAAEAEETAPVAEAPVAEEAPAETPVEESAE